MKILAMDLSLSCPAFAVIEDAEGMVKVHHVSHIKTNAKKSLGYRLFQIYKHMEDVLCEYDVDEIVREKGFSKFPATTQKLFQVVGISTVCAYKYGYDVVHEIAPTSVKKAITGNGKSDKDKVATALGTVYGINIDFKTDDESDACAVGVTHLIQKGLTV